MPINKKLTNKQVAAQGVKRTDNGSNGNLNESDSRLKHKVKK
ncbi:hypothetical protein [Clostridium ganghwense]|uniref:YuzL family protein n=1 Tax=Clostridium ganghwense TaxID=312089 RepID=A0ABT4CU07_9CLOT|nr:hypothetical protein [Clostridium ganghwense]MCY6372559.1 hypothetical protein [Clostridium ganghwense]